MFPEPADERLARSARLTVSEAFPMYATRDLPRALDFYRDLLGAEETYRFPGEGEPVYVGLKLGASDLGLSADPAAPAPSAAVELCVYADDCDAAVALLREHGVRVIDEPADQPWGERMARVADPDGNRVVLMARPNA
jgi:lactoylglutathione lyase